MQKCFKCKEQIEEGESKTCWDCEEVFCKNCIKTDVYGDPVCEQCYKYYSVNIFNLDKSY